MVTLVVGPALERCAAAKGACPALPPVWIKCASGVRPKGACPD